jgi:uncharacterized membrane protein HdeD (DUF308 family)
MSDTPPTDATPEPESPATASGGTRANVEDASAAAAELIDRGAPWSPRTSWTIVLIEGIVVALIGLVFIFEPFGGASTTLQLAGLALLAGSGVTTFQLWRHEYRHDIEMLASFRAGSGVTVGGVVIVATFVTDVTDAVTATLAVVVGIGFIVFGVVGIASSMIRRQIDAPLPLASLVLNAVLALAGLLLLFAGWDGSDSVDGLFNVLGVLLIASGLALAGYSFMLYQQDAKRS